MSTKSKADIQILCKSNIYISLTIKDRAKQFVINNLAERYILSICGYIIIIHKGNSRGGLMVLGNFPVPGRLTNLDNSRTRA